MYAEDKAQEQTIRLSPEKLGLPEGPHSGHGEEGVELSLGLKFAQDHP